MKLWYQSLARETEATPYGEMLKRVIGKACDPGTTVHLQGVRESAGIGVHYRFLEHHDIREVVTNAMKSRARRLRCLPDRQHQRRRHPRYAAPSGDFLKRVRDFYGPDVYPGAK